MNEPSEFVQPLESPVAVDRNFIGPPGAVTLPARGRQPRPTGLRNPWRPTGSVWQYPKITFGTIAAILVLCLIAYLMLRAVLG